MPIKYIEKPSRDQGHSDPLKYKPVRLTRWASSKLSEQQCRRIKAHYRAIFESACQLDVSMSSSLTKGQLIDVDNLIHPALNVLTGIDRLKNGDPTMPARPPTMDEGLYKWAELLYARSVPLCQLQRAHPDLCNEGFLEWARRHGRRNAELEKFCGVK